MTVDDIYNDRTLRHKIRIHLMDIIPINSEDSVDLVESNDPTKTLENVAMMLDRIEMRDRNRKDSSGRSRRAVRQGTDLTVFLTRDSFGPAGNYPRCAASPRALKDKNLKCYYRNGR